MQVMIKIYHSDISLQYCTAASDISLIICSYNWARNFENW